MLPVQQFAATSDKITMNRCTQNSRQIFDPTAPHFLSYFTDLNDENFKLKINNQACVYDTEQLDDFKKKFESSNFHKIKHDESKNPFSIVKDAEGNIYALSRKILGKGRAGKVKLAQDLKTRELVAVKISHDGFLGTDVQGLKELKRFRGEQTRCSEHRFKHYVFMKYFDGITVSQFEYYIRAHELELSLDQLIHFRESLFKALDVLTERNISHGDLHSSNILIDPRTWKAEIIDLGLVSSMSSSTEHMKYRAQMIVDPFVPKCNLNKDSPLYSMVVELLLVARKYMKYEFLIKLATCLEGNHPPENFLAELLSAILEKETFSTKAMLLELLNISKKWSNFDSKI